MTSVRFFTDIDLQNQNELLGARLENSATDPTTPGDGQIYFNTAGSTVIKFYTGTVWLPLGAIDDASTGTDRTLSASEIDTRISASAFTIDGLTGATANITSAGTDTLAFADASDSNNDKKQTLFSFIGSLAGTGLQQNATSGALELSSTPSTSYTDTFLIADWTGSSPTITLSYPQSTHGLSTNQFLSVRVFEDLGATQEDVTQGVNIVINETTGDVTVTIKNQPFDGSILIMG